MFIDNLTNEKKTLCTKILVYVTAVMAVLCIFTGFSMFRFIGIVSCFLLFVCLKTTKTNKRTSAIVYSVILALMIVQQLFGLAILGDYSASYAMFIFLVIIAYSAFSALVVASIYMGKENKSLSIVATLGILQYVFILLKSLSKLSAATMNYVIMAYAGGVIYSIAMILFYIAMLFFYKTYDLHKVFLFEKNLWIIHSASPQRAFEMLKAELDAGTITEERYQQERAKIIHRL